MFWTSKKSGGTLHTQVIIDLLLVTFLIKEVNAVATCYTCETMGGQGIPCEDPSKHQCSPQRNASCVKSKAEQKDVNGKWVPQELRQCSNKPSPNPGSSDEVCNDLPPNPDLLGRECLCFTDNCNNGPLPEVPKAMEKPRDSSSGAPLFTGSPQPISPATFFLQGAWLFACYYHLI